MKKYNYPNVSQGSANKDREPIHSHSRRTNSYAGNIPIKIFVSPPIKEETRESVYINSEPYRFTQRKLHPMSPDRDHRQGRKSGIVEITHEIIRGGF